MSNLAHDHHCVLVAALALTVGACGDPSTVPSFGEPQVAENKFWEVGASVSWNQTARDLIAARAIASPISQVRILAYLSVAQHRAIVAAEASGSGGNKPYSAVDPDFRSVSARVATAYGNDASPAAAAAGASLVVLKSFFPLDAALLDNKLLVQRAAAPWPGEQTKDFAAGESLGREIGAQIVDYAATDRTGMTAAPPNPGGPGSWTGVNPVVGLYGARTFALLSGDQFRPPPPPAFGSAAFHAALAEVRAFSLNLTPEQLAIAQYWANRGPAHMNGVAAELIVAHRRTERAAARILALANMAGFDATSACFDAKLAYYSIRPAQADSQIKLPVGLPNHPSYPSGHSCVTGAYATVLAAEFPQEGGRLRAMTMEAGESRIYAGLHYRYDCDVGRELGRQVAEFVLRTMGSGHTAIPMD